MIWVIAAALIILLWGIIESKFLTLNECVVKSTKIPIEADGLRLLLLTDLHDQSFGKGNSRLIKKIENSRADALLVVGDALNCRHGYSLKNADALLLELSKKYLIYYVEGNHERRLKERLPDVYINYKNKLKNSKVIFLDNTYRIFRGIRLTGLSVSCKEYYNRFDEKTVFELLGKADSSFFNILLAHTPVEFESYCKWGADLCFCGHIHGGLLRIPFIGGFISPGMRLFPKYDAGKYSIGDKKMIVSRGAGGHTFKLRYFNPPELLTVTLKKS